MPELPEVETVRRGLQALEGTRVTEVTLRRPDLRFAIPPSLAQAITGQRLGQIARRAKYLLFHFENGQVMLLHLGMSGRVLIKEFGVQNPESSEELYQKHDHVVITFENHRLIFNDARRFGFVDVCDEDGLATNKHLATLGPEPLSDDFSGNILHTALSTKHTDIKAALMDQRVVAGLGNIYVCEALFAAGIHPKMPAHGISRQKCVLLAEEIRRVLNAAIASGGSTLRDYVRSDGGLGYFQHEFRVYGRENEACSVCKTAIGRITQAGRSTFFCGGCQKGG